MSIMVTITFLLKINFIKCYHPSDTDYPGHERCTDSSTSVHVTSATTQLQESTYDSTVYTIQPERSGLSVPALSGAPSNINTHPIHKCQ